jgi:NAD(P)H-hydrate epimerase
LTPRPGEAARLAGAFGIAKSGDRRELAMALAERLHAVVVLKGRDSIVADADGNITVVAAGSSALAMAGSGDVLAGIIGALAAQPGMMNCRESAGLGADIHGIAGEIAPGILIADELPEYAGQVIRMIRSNDIF